MGANLDTERIAKALGAERRGTVSARGGYFGALQLAAEVAARFRGDDANEEARHCRPQESLRREIELSL